MVKSVVLPRTVMLVLGSAYYGIVALHGEQTRVSFFFSLSPRSHFTVPRASQKTYRQSIN